VLRSTLPGDDGRFFFSGDERLLNAFSWAEVVSPVENAAEITVHDAHTGEFIDTQRVNDGVLRGVLAGVDVKIDASEDVSVEWDATNMKYTFKSGFGTEVGHIHVVANPLTLQVGANPGQKVDALIGEVTRSSLELENVLLVNRAVAEEAIPIVDKAIEEVSSQRARIGAYINRLNATINILDITAENLSASESRIRDLDMANQTIDFTRDQMLVQAATAMLAQANTLPQSVLTLLR
jgi:flagellin